MTYLPSPRKFLIGEHDASTANKLATTLTIPITPGKRSVLPGTTGVPNAKSWDISPEHVRQVNPRLTASHRVSRVGSLT